MDKICFCAKCRYETSHLSSYHKCGLCHAFGHGQIECKNNTRLNELKEKIKKNARCRSLHSTRMFNKIYTFHWIT